MLDVTQKLGKNLKKIRTLKKMSQGDIARFLDVDKSYISNIENGKKNPTLLTLNRLAKALDVGPEDLIR